MTPEVQVLRSTAARTWDYPSLHALQLEIAERVRQGGAGALLFSELAPVITRGRRTPTSDILSRLPGQTPVPVVEVERGGLATYHGPGQWVVFAVDRLERLVGDSRGVRKMVEALLASALEVGQAYRRTVWQGEGAELGAWSERGKFAAVGIQVRGGVVLHGLAVNGFRTAESFEGLRPCGLDRAVDFLLEEASEAEFLRLREALEASLSRRLWQNGKPG